MLQRDGRATTNVSVGGSVRATHRRSRLRGVRPKVVGLVEQRYMCDGWTMACVRIHVCGNKWQQSTTCLGVSGILLVCGVMEPCSLVISNHCQIARKCWASHASLIASKDTNRDHGDRRIGASSCVSKAGLEEDGTLCAEYVTTQRNGLRSRSVFGEQRIAWREDIWRGGSR